MHWFRLIIYVLVAAAAVGIVIAIVIGNWSLVTWLGWSMLPLWLLIRAFSVTESPPSDTDPSDDP